MVFAGAPSQFYQLRQWLWPLERLEKVLRARGHGGVAILLRHPRGLEQIQAETSLPVRLAHSTLALEAELTSPEVLVALYPNQATLNFQAMAHPQPAHVHLNHGESEKVSMVSNNLKGYDHVLTAGAAARRRLGTHLIGFDVGKCIDVGRPQNDAPSSAPARLPATARRTVLYAPTWEGDRPAMSYSSVGPAGMSIVRQLVELGWRVIYRPHPQTGTRSRVHARYDRAIRSYLGAQGGDHYVDGGIAYGWQFSAADAVVADLSAVAFDAVAHDSVTVVVRPSPEGELLDVGGVLKRVPTVGRDGSGVAEALDTAQRPAGERARATMAKEYYGDTTPGAQIDRFTAAVVRIADDRAAALDGWPSARSTAPKAEEK